MSASLTYLDFFSIPTQRIATEIASNCCASISVNHFSLLKDIIPRFETILLSHDPETVKNISNCVCGIVESFQSHSEKVQELITPTISKHLLCFLNPDVAVSNDLKPKIIKSIAAIVKISPELTGIAIKEKLGDQLYQILTKHAPAFDDNDEDAMMLEKDSNAIVQALIYVPKDILNNSLNIFSQVFPSVSIDDNAAFCGPYKVMFSSEAQRAKDNKRIQVLNSEPEVLIHFSKITISLLIDVYSSSVDVSIRRISLGTIIKIISALPSDTLQKVVESLELSLLLSSIFSQRDNPSLVVGALEIGQILLEKVPEVYVSSFFRGGIINEVKSILETEQKRLDEKQAQSSKVYAVLAADNHESEGEDENGNNDDDDEGDNNDDDDNDDEEDEEEDEHADDSDMADNSEEDTIEPGSSSKIKMYFFDSDLSEVIISDAKAFLESYDAKMIATGSGEAMQKDLDDLISLSKSFINDREHLQQHFATFADELNRVCEFELLSSHILRSVLDALTTGTEEQIAHARKAFLLGFFKDGHVKPFERLLERLAELLSRFEKFEVISSDPFSLHSSPASLARQLRINLMPEDNDMKKKVKPITISIQAIATFNAVDEFFKHKISVERLQSTAFGSRILDNGLGNIFTSLLESADSEAETATSSRNSPALPKPKSAKSSPGPGKSTDSHMDEDDEEEEEVEVDEEVEPAETEDKEEFSLQGPASYDWHLEFYLDGEHMPQDSTIYGSIYRYLQAKEEAKRANGETPNKNFASSIWTTAYKVTFKKCSGPKSTFKEPVIEAEDLNPQVDVPASFGSNESIAVVVRLLSVLFGINSSIPEMFGADSMIRPLATTKFLSSKLTAKLNRQLEEPLVVVGGILPDWTVDATRLYPFLFPFETRHLFLQSTSFGYSRLIYKWQSQANNPSRQRDGSWDDRRDAGPRPMGRLMRQKVRISRNHILQSAIKVMDLYGFSPYVLEVEFFDDVGTGLGPTLEFYATVSKQFTRKKLRIWRDDNQDPKSSYVFSPQGLFPLPYAPEFFDTKSGAKVLHFFKSLGTFIARSMLDSRIIDINFNPVFFRLAMANSMSDSTIGTVHLVDKHLGKSLAMLQKFVDLKTAAPPGTDVNRIEVDGATLEDLSLDFTYPGLPDRLLTENGGNVAVTMDNVEKYIAGIIDLTLGFGVSTQINAFREGFSQVFPFAALHAFNPEELVVLCGQGENDWSFDTLMASAKADHGYSMDSRVVRDLFSIMSEFTREEQKLFLQFLTGSPNLPIGGFKALNPPFTIVCRQSESPLTPDDYLPTVMTCVNYFKLPNYTTKEILKERIKVAVMEGSGSFLLS